MGSGERRVHEGEPSPTIVGGKLYLRLKDCVACYDLTAGLRHGGAGLRPGEAGPEKNDNAK